MAQRSELGIVSPELDGRGGSRIRIQEQRPDRGLLSTADHTSLIDYSRLFRRIRRRISQSAAA